jgi:LmbE family N-acetylglucosaminyl deacetylase
MAASTVAAASLLKKGEAAGEPNKVRGRTYIAACPPVKASIPRTPGPMRIMMIGGHPDDADIICGCTAAKLIAKGCRVKFVAACNGDIGHHIYDRATTARVRRQETLNAAKVWGLDSYDIYGFGDARCPNTIEAREMVAAHIMDFEPDIIMTHRDCDYHVDHRTIGTLVKAGGYMLGCPHWIKGSKPLRRRPLSCLRFQCGNSRRQELASFVETAWPPRRRQIRMSGVETSSFGRLICGLSQMQG